MPDVKGLLRDPEFRQLPLADQKTVLGRVDADFASLSDTDFQTVLSRIGGAAESNNMPGSVMPGVQDASGVSIPLPGMPSAPRVDMKLAPNFLGIGSVLNYGSERDSRGVGLGDRPPSKVGPVPRALMTPITSGFEQMGRGAKIFLAGEGGPGTGQHTSWDDRAQGVSDMYRGAMLASTPFTLPLAAKTLAVDVPKKLLGQVLTKRVLPALGGAAVGGGGAALLAPELGAGPGVTHVLEDAGTLAGGFLGAKAGERFLTPLRPPSAQKEYDIAPLVRITNPSSKRQDIRMQYESAVPDLISAPKVAGGRDLKQIAQNWKGKQGSFTEYLVDEVVPQAKQSAYEVYDQIAAPYRDRLRLSGREIAADIAAAVKTDALQGPMSAYTENLIASYNSTPAVPLTKAEEDIKRIGGLIHEFYDKSPSGMQISIIKDSNDVAALERLGRALRARVYSGLDGYGDNGGRLAAQAMKRYGAITEAGEDLAGLKVDALKGSAVSATERAMRLAGGMAHAKAGNPMGAAAKIKSALIREDTVDEALVKFFKGFNGERPPVFVPPPPVKPDEVLQGSTNPQRLNNEDLANLLAYARPDAKSARDSAAILAREHTPSISSARNARGVAQHPLADMASPYLQLPSGGGGQFESTLREGISRVAAPLRAGPLLPRQRGNPLRGENPNIKSSTPYSPVSPGTPKGAHVDLFRGLKLSDAEKAIIMEIVRTEGKSERTIDGLKHMWKRKPDGSVTRTK